MLPTGRRGVPTFHSAQDINAIVRDYTKWDDTPVGLQHFASRSCAPTRSR
jgi:hypothetical protein